MKRVLVLAYGVTCYLLLLAVFRWQPVPEAAHYQIQFLYSTESPHPTYDANDRRVGVSLDERRFLVAEQLSDE